MVSRPFPVHSVQPEHAETNQISLKISRLARANASKERKEGDF
jgi:hypothetical protein